MWNAVAERSVPRGRVRSSAQRATPSIVGTATALPSHRYAQRDLAKLACSFLPEGVAKQAAIERFFDHMGVEHRFLALRAERYSALNGLASRNDAWIEAALGLGERVVRSLLDEVGLRAEDISLLATTTVTGIAVPSLDARLMNCIPFSRSLKRLPLFGLGCLGGAAGIARVADYLRGAPTEAAILLSVELCSLTFQPHDGSIANIVSTGLFGDGASAVLLVGSAHPLASTARVRVRGSRSAFFAKTERVMGWDVVDSGFKVVLSSDVPRLVREHVPAALDSFLAEHELTRDHIDAWVVHPGGPKVIDAMEESLDLPRGTLAATRESLASVGNLSSSSVLFLLDRMLRAGPLTPGAHGVMMAMGPAFCAEMVLLQC